MVSLLGCLETKALPPGASLGLKSCSSCAPLPVSPLPCLCPDTVWLVLWLVTVPQGPCQMFVLRESAGLALFRSLTVPLLVSVPSCCCCFTLRCPFFNFLGLAVLADASTAFAIVSLRLFSFGHNWHYSPPVGSLANSQHSCLIIATSPLHATPVDRSLDMRALGGAITRWSHVHLGDSVEMNG